MTGTYPGSPITLVPPIMLADLLKPRSISMSGTYAPPAAQTTGQLWPRGQGK